ncbi:MAG: hypothetical protein LBQ43_02310 [Holosporales bacterium]|jgi:acetyl-CoA carboxylase biotin carboxyl carrier protein|nr:hypothetical protein [Holosporales bacterium]
MSLDLSQTDDITVKLVYKNEASEMTDKNETELSINEDLSLATSPGHSILQSNLKDHEISAESLARVLVANDLSEIEYEENGRRIYLSRKVTSAPVTTVTNVIQQEVPPPPPKEDAPESTKDVNWKLHPGVVLSPMVGVAYMSPEPGAEPFVRVGSIVTPGQILLIIEAMKVLNPIKASKAGKVIAILFHDQKPIEYNEPLLVIAE